MENIITFRTRNSNEWLIPLLSYFISIKSIDDKIELLRSSLCSLPNFSPNKLFHYLDNCSKNFLSLKDFIEFLREMRIPFDEKYLRIVIHNFDKDGDFSLNKNEFLGLILPKKNMNLAVKIKNYDCYDNNSKNIDIYNMKKILGKILYEELELVKNCIINAKSCKEIIGFTFFEAFCHIAENSKYINENLLYNFLLRNNVDINMNDIHQLMFRLDADNDGKISFEEFKEIFFPVKGEEIIYKINNNKNIINNFNYFKYKEKEKEEENQEKIMEKELTKITNLVNFTFARKTNNSFRISYKKKERKINGFNKLINYKYNYNEDLIKNKENTNIELNKKDNGESIYIRTKNIISKKNNHLFQPNISSKKIIQNQSNIQSSDNYSKICNQIRKSYQYFYSNNPAILKKEINKKIKVYSNNQKRIKTQEKYFRYQSPKIKHTKSPLYYDYSTYSNEDGDEYFKKKMKENRRVCTDKRTKNEIEIKLKKKFGGFDHKKEIRNNYENMKVKEEAKKENKNKIIDTKNNNKEVKKREYKLLNNSNEEDDIKINNFDDIRRKNNQKN